MQDNTLLMIFIGVASVALLLQGLALIGIYRSVRTLSNRLNEMASGIARDLNTVAARTEDVLATIRSVGEGIDSLRRNVEKTLVIVHNRVESLDTFLGETTDIARLQILRVQDAIDTSSRKMEELFEVLRSSILAPAFEVNAIIRGIRVGMDFLFRKRKGLSGSYHPDEELFI
jgi:hypothetical protein